MLKILMTKSYGYTNAAMESALIPFGSVLIANRIANGLFGWDYRCIEGIHAGYRIPREYCIEYHTTDPVKEAREQLDKEYAEREQHWLERYDQLERDFKEMERHYQSLLNDRRVLLTGKVAAAVQWFERRFKEHWKYWFLQHVLGWRIGQPVPTEVHEALLPYAGGNMEDIEECLAVLVHGYKTEPSLEEKIKTAVAAICDDRADAVELSQRITDAVKAVLESA